MGEHHDRLIEEAEDVLLDLANDVSVDKEMRLLTAFRVSIYLDRLITNMVEHDTGLAKTALEYSERRPPGSRPLGGWAPAWERDRK